MYSHEGIFSCIRRVDNINVLGVFASLGYD